MHWWLIEALCNGHHVADDILKRTFMNATRNILIQSLLEYIPDNPIQSSSTLFEIYLCRKGDRPLPQPIMTRHPERKKEESSRICYPEMRIVKNPLRYRHLPVTALDLTIPDIITIGRVI